MLTIEERLNGLGLELPEVPAAVGNYLPYVRSGQLVYISGTLPMKDGKLMYEGKVGMEQTAQSGYEAARLCLLNSLANLKLAVGKLDEVKRVVMVTGYVSVGEGFYEVPAVINGASDLLVQLFGDKGKHARAAVGVAVLPKNATVEVQLVVEC